MSQSIPVTMEAEDEIKELKRKNKVLRAALVSMVGVKTKEELKELKRTIIFMHCDHADKTMSLVPINALLETL